MAATTRVETKPIHVSYNKNALAIIMYYDVLLYTAYQAHKWENYYPMQKDCWGYNRLLDSNGYATTQELISILVQTVRYVNNSVATFIV